MALDAVRVRWVPASDQLNSPEARCGHVAMAIDSREVWGEEFLVVHGGINKSKDALGDLVVLQCDQEAWFSPAPAAVGPAARAFHAGAVIDRRLYVFGGHVYVKQQHKLHQFNDLWVLDTDTWEWSRLDVSPDAPQPCPRDRASLVAVGPSKLLLYGGADAMNRRLDDLWVFDLDLGMWREVKTTGPRPRPRCCTSLTAVENRVLMFAGDIYGISNELWSLRGLFESSQEAPTAQWTPLQLEGPPPAPRRGHAAAALGRWVVFMGGLSEQKSMLGIKSRNEYLSDVVVLDRQVDRVAWRSVEAMSPGEAAPLAREKHSLTALAGGRLLMFGGTDGQTTLGDAWWLDLEDISTPTPPSISPGDLPPPQPFARTPSAHAELAQQQALEAVGQPAGAVEAASAGSSAAQQAQHGAAGPGGALAQQAQQPPASASFPYLPAAIATSLPAVVPAGLSNAFTSFRERFGLPATASQTSLSSTGGGVGPPAAAGDSSGAAAAAAAAATAAPAPVGPGGRYPAAPYFYAPAAAAAGAMRASGQSSSAVDASSDEGLLALGERALLQSLQERGGEGGAGGVQGAHVEGGGWDPRQLVEAARHFLASCHPEDLRLGDLPVLMADYRRLARVGWAMALQEHGLDAILQRRVPSQGRGAGGEGAGGRPPGGDLVMPGRFLHLSVEDLRMREMGEMLADYQLLLASQTPDTEAEGS